MADGVARAVRKEIDRLRKEISRRESELASLKDDLGRHEEAYSVLGGDGAGADQVSARRPARRPARKARLHAMRDGAVNWNDVLDNLPARFSMDDLRKIDAAKKMSPAYLRQIAARWVKERKTGRVERGRYRKAVRV